MCGICGELSFSGRPVSADVIGRMTDAIAHRGPDGRGVHCAGAVGLGHRRLAIIDLSERGAQPMWSRDRRLCIVYNGEIYNYREIRQELRSLGHDFVSESDTEVILASIRQWGVEGAVSRFIGMFAFGLWDEDRQVLTLCRDRVGIKPLYYQASADGLVFGSEMRALLAHPGSDRTLDAVGLRQFFVTGQTLTPHTVLRGTRQVRPGHFVSVAIDGQLEETCYWSLSSVRRASRTATLEQVAEELEELLTSAFSYRLVSDVPVALFLSGGIDSSLVSSVLKNRLDADILNITIGFENAAFDEAPIAEKTAEHLGVRHLVHRIDSAEAADAVESFADVYDVPFGDTSGIPTRILSEVARRHVKVALSADGGDEQFCGYDSYAAYLKSYRQAQRVPRFVRGVAARVLRSLGSGALVPTLVRAMGLEGQGGVARVSAYEKLVEILGARGTGDLLRVMNEKAWSSRDVSRLLGETEHDAAAIYDGTVVAALPDDGSPEETLDAMLRMDYQLFLRDDILTKVDRASMSVSLECRDPFLDHRIAEFAFSLPLEYLTSPQTPKKRLLKALLRQWVPSEIIDAPKRGFSIPLHRWLKTVWRPVVGDYLSPESVRRVGVLDATEVQRQLDGFYKHDSQRAERIWMMLSFQMWAYRWYLSDG